MNIYALATLGSAVEVLDHLRSRIALRGVIGLTQRDATDTISGYAYMGDYCVKHGLPFISVESYGLTKADDRQRLSELDIDVLLVLGWQRLIPEWLIKQCQIGAIGVHGSASGITGGRGRSPQNWALILGKNEFHLSIFWIDPGIDSGAVIDARAFPLTPYDDIQTAYFKTMQVTAEMLTANFADGSIADRRALPQAGEPKYLPQRLPEDGEIDWRRSSAELYDFIRALTRPYPGAYSNFLDSRLTVWRARPFALDITWDSFEPGQIVRCFYTDQLLVKTGDGLLLVDDYSVTPTEGHDQLGDGVVLVSSNFSDQMARIVQRHTAKYPDMILSDDIMALVTNVTPS